MDKVTLSNAPFYLTLAAYYGNITVSTDVIVEVTDLNDNCPTFVDERHGDDCHGDITVFEGQLSGATVTTVLATDPDVGDNGDVVYSFINGRIRSAFYSVSHHLSLSALSPCTVLSCRRNG